MTNYNAKDIAQLEVAVSSKLSAYSQESQLISKMLPSIRINSTNQRFPIFEGMNAYNPSANGSSVEILEPSTEYKDAAIFYTNKKIEIPLATKRSMTAIDDPDGSQLISLIAKAVAESKFVTLEYNIHKAIAAQKYEAGKNIFTAGNINQDNSGLGFREAVNNAISYLKTTLNGMSHSRRIIMAIPEKSWYKLTASQKLSNFFNGYGMANTNFNIQTIESIFTENSGTNVQAAVGGMRFLDSKFASGESELIWNEDLEFYIFTSTDDVFADRASIKKLEGIERLSVVEDGNNTRIDFYTDYGYYIDKAEAFTKVTFSIV